MIRTIVQYGHPALRKKGAEIPSVTAPIKKLAQDMLDTMYDAHGVGLAAQQVGEALQLAVIDVSESSLPSQLFVGVQEVPVESMMPLVLINPTITKSEGEESGTEGCLSFPKIQSEIVRAATVHVSATGLDEKPLRFVATGLLGRAVQHELDHLNGVLFIDRMSKEARRSFDDEIEELQKETVSNLKKK